MNTIKIVFLMTLMMVIFLTIGFLFGGETGLIIAFVISLLMNFGSYWFSDKIVLMMYKAKQINENDMPRFYRTVSSLVQRNNLPMPRLYLIEENSPNAFATGRNPQNSAVAVTSGLLNMLNNDELEGVLAHELAHIQHRDILIGAFVATLVGTITFIARMAGWSMMFFGGSSDDDENVLSSAVTSLALLILAPIAAVMIQMAISRSREYFADTGGAKLCQRPLSLATALKKISGEVQYQPLNKANPASAHMFIVHPFKAGGIKNLFSTHPPIEERIKRLNYLSQTREF